MSVENYNNYYYPKVNITSMSFSKDGNNILYASNFNNAYQVFSFDVKLKKINQLTFNNATSFLPITYILNDTAIVYQSDSGNEVNNLNILNLSTGESITITSQFSEKVYFIEKLSESYILFRIKNQIFLFDVENMITNDSIEVDSNNNYVSYYLSQKKWILFDSKTKEVYQKNEGFDNDKHIIQRLDGYPTAYKDDNLLYITQKDRLFILTIHNMSNKKNNIVFQTNKQISFLSIGKKTIMVLLKYNSLSTIVLLDIESRSILKKFNETKKRSFFNFAFDKQNDKLAISWDSIYNPSIVQVYDVCTKSEIKLNLTNKQTQIGNCPKEISFLTKKEAKIFGLLYTPAGNKRGAILYLHGGPGHKAKYGFNTLIQFLVSSGWVVLDIDYHGSSGHGLRFKNSINGNIGVLELEDCEAAYNYLLELLSYSNKKIGVLGESYGGFLSLLCLEKLSNTFSFGISINGVLDWNQSLNNLPNFWKNHISYIYEKFGNPDTNYQHLFDISPINGYKQINVPVLIFQSSKDARVSSNQALLFQSAMEKKNKQSKLVIFENDGHEISFKKNQIILYEKLNSYLMSL